MHFVYNYVRIHMCIDMCVCVYRNVLYVLTRKYMCYPPNNNNCEESLKININTFTYKELLAVITVLVRFQLV